MSASTKFLIVLAALVIAGLVTAVMIAATHKGNETRSRTYACHSLGPGFHYWQDRDQCVKYVRLP